MAVCHSEGNIISMSMLTQWLKLSKAQLSLVFCNDTQSKPMKKKNQSRREDSSIHTSQWFSSTLGNSVFPRRTQVYFYIWTNKLFLSIVSVSKLGIPLTACFQNNPWDTLSPATTARSPFRCHVGISVCSTQRWIGMKGPPSDIALLPENSKLMSLTFKLNKNNSLHVF